MKDYIIADVGVIPNDWIVLNIQDLTPKNKKYTIVDGPFGSNLKTIHYRKTGIPIITSGYVTDGKFFASEYLYVDEQKFKQEKRSAVKGGDIVMAKIGERCGASSILPKEHPTGILSGNALKITIDESKFSVNLIWQILWNKHIQGKLELLRTTGAQPALSIANLKRYEIALPSNQEEQIAIAAALSDADSLIGSLEKLIDKKRNLKQGTMQQLLQPKKGWAVESLGEIGECIIGLTYKPENIKEDGILVLRSSNVQNGILSYEDNVYVDVAVPEKLIVRENDILVCVRNGSRDLIGKCALIEGKAIGETFGAFMSVFRSSFNRYLFFVFQSSIFKRQIDEHLGATINQITNKSMNSFQIPFPSEEEQEQIVNILSDMNGEIVVLEAKLKKYRQLKQGMMQNLLTGKIRLI